MTFSSGSLSRFVARITWPNDLLYLAISDFSLSITLQYAEATLTTSTVFGDTWMTIQMVKHFVPIRSESSNMVLLFDAKDRGLFHSARSDRDYNPDLCPLAASSAGFPEQTTPPDYHFSLKVPDWSYMPLATSTNDAHSLHPGSILEL